MADEVIPHSDYDYELQKPGLMHRIEYPELRIVMARQAVLASSSQSQVRVVLLRNDGRVATVETCQLDEPTLETRALASAYHTHDQISPYSAPASGFSITLGRGLWGGQCSYPAASV